MNCEICNTELICDSLGPFCPNDACCFVSEMPHIFDEQGIIPLLYENEKLIKWIQISDGTKYWYLNGQLHREDGPAVEYADGAKEWYLNGYCHRENGPAVEWINGTKEWWLSGKFQKNELSNLQH